MHDRHPHHERGFGLVCLNAGVVLELSWAPMLAFLSGWSWPPLPLAIGGHYFALAFLVFAPLGYGAALFLESPGAERRELMADWAWRCLLPLLSYALGIKLVLSMLPGLTPLAIAALMGATLPLAVYGWVSARNP